MSDVNGIEQDAEKLAKKIASTRPKKPAPTIKDPICRFDADGKRIIRHDAGRLPEILDALGEALAEDDRNLFVFADKRLVRLHEAADSPIKGVTRPRGSLILQRVDGAHLVELAGLAARHEHYSARSKDFHKIDCPRRIADSYLARGHHPELRALSGFIEAPTVTPAGRLIDVPGYDLETGIYLAGGAIAGYTTPPVHPTMDDAARAAERLLQRVTEFPFVAGCDRSAFLSAILTVLGRRMLPAAPMFGITAPTAGTGKSKLADDFALVATGRTSSIMTLGHEEAETEKRLHGVLLGGDLVVCLDNAVRPIGSAILCQILSQQSLCFRPLQGSDLITAPTNFFLCATGNNLTIVEDLKRRVVMIRLDAGVERPEQRIFKNDHEADVMGHRGEMIRDALTIILAYLKAGAPAIEGHRPLGGFELWDRMARRPLIWIGMDDPLIASEDLRDQDPDQEAMQMLLGAWYDVFGSEAKTAAEVVSEGMEPVPMGGGYSHPELRDALQLVCSEKPNPRRLGNWLRVHRNRIVGKLTLKQAMRDAHAKIARWRVTSGECQARAADLEENDDISIPF